MKFAQLIIGPAGSGKSTYCDTMQQHGKACRRMMHAMNLDPAAENFAYAASCDIRDLITIDDVMEECNLGPNGALVYCMEYLEEHLHEWLAEELEGFGEDDYLLVDCPGQIELFTHIPVLRTFVDFMKNDGWNICAVFCLDSHFITDSAKFISGCFQALAAMVTLEVAHFNILTKVDLLDDKEQLEEMIFPNSDALLADLSRDTPPKLRELNKVVAQLVDGYGMVSFSPLDITDEDSIEHESRTWIPSQTRDEAKAWLGQTSIAAVLLQVDTALQYGEDLDVETRDYGGED